MPALYAQPAQPAWPDRCKHVHVSLAEVRNAAPRTDPVLREAAFQIYLRVARRELREALERMSRASLHSSSASACPVFLDSFGVCPKALSLAIELSAS